ncbi:MAG: hypothetical protein IPJ39_21945 [Saprospiraceae bacterium]|nr:hypothetical protein [Saprospiraceae bacterium]
MNAKCARYAKCMAIEVEKAFVIHDVNPDLILDKGMNKNENRSVGKSRYV